MAQLLLDKMLKKRGMSKYRFAQLLKANYKNIGRYFQPDYDPKLSTLRAWANVLKCRIRDLYRE